MNICMLGVEVGPSKEGGIIGGTVNNIIRLAEGLHKKGHQIFLVTTQARYSGNQFLNVPWAEVRGISIRGKYPSLKYGFEFAVKAILEIKRLLKKEELTLVHSHSGFPAIGIISSFSRTLFNMKSIHSLYCPIPKHSVEISPFNLTQSAFLVKNSFLRVDRIIALTKNIKKSLINIGLQPKKLEIIPPIIDMDVFNPKISGDEIRRNLGLTPDDKLLVFVGNLTKTKGVHVLLRAMKQVVQDNPETHLLIILHIPRCGLNSETRLVREKINSYGLEGNIQFMGITKKMPNVLAACDVLVAPFESTIGPSDYPIPLLEAMATGKPVIATDVGGISEIITNNNSGLLIEPNNSAQLAAAISTVIQNEDLSKKFGQRAINFVQKNLSVDEVVKKTERVYKAVLEA